MRVLHSALVVDVDMVGDCGTDYHHQDDHRLQTDHVVLQHRPGSLRYLDGLGVSDSQEEVDADVGEDQDEEGDDDGDVDKDALELRPVLCSLQSSEEGDEIIVNQAGKLPTEQFYPQIISSRKVICLFIYIYIYFPRTPFKLQLL